MKKSLIGQCFAEFIGTFILIFIGAASVASLILSGAEVTFWEMALCWGMAVTFAIYITGAISGGHINPAVTIALAVSKVFDKKKVVPYIVSQVLGAFAGAAVVYGLYGKAIALFEQAHKIVRAADSGWQTAGIFSTFPKPYLTLFGAFMVEFAITAFLMLIIRAVTDAKNEGAPKGGLAAVIIGLTIAVIGLTFGPLTGFAMNPARDLGPRLFMMLAGWGVNVLGPSCYGLIVPIFGPILGAILGTLIYDWLVEPYLVVESR